MKKLTMLIEEVFITEENYLGVILFHPFLGGRTGYVGINDAHPLFKKEFNEDERIYKLDVHGGVSFSGHLEVINLPLWFIGFDCHHYGDIPDFNNWNEIAKTYNILDDIKKHYDYQKETHSTLEGIIWTKEMVKNEIKILSCQLKEFENERN